ncbi:MAG TPA: ATP-dependent Clp protease ATP-binding subunit, partial [Cryomorphaceae bacterium]|nr:ATP-dependent Clp protease ATP-binding subunit [Cryomorphaceae bacterium]
PNAGAKKVLEEAQKLCTRYGEDQVTPLDLLEALVTPDVGFESAEIRRLPLALYEVVDFRASHAGNVPEGSSNGEAKNPSREVGVADLASHQAILDKYCENLNQWADEGKIDPVLGRDRELKQMVEILGKRISPNVMVVGDPGVGKTSVVTGLVLKIQAGQVPEILKSAVIYSLDVSGQLIAGAFKGEVEERLKSILKAVKAQEGKAILFIDEIHILLDAKGPVGSGVVNLLKPELSRGEITLIGATTSDEYQKYIEKDSAFNRRFSRLTINEPDDIVASQMLAGLVPKYEEFHQMKISKEAILTSVAMAKKYIKDKHLPASAIELMDFSMACANQMNSTSSEVLSELEREYNADENPDPTSYKTKIRNRLSELLVGRIEGDEDERDILDTIQTLKGWTSEKKTEIDDIDITSITAYKSGIPAGNLRAKEQEKLQNAEAILRERVVGQDHVIEAVARGIKAFRTNLKEPKDPGAIFFFTGSTGTGKTELAKAIAQLLFDDEDALMRFDMSEFQESHSVATLLGAPPGYAGYDEGGILVNNVRKRPYSVVLFDEIEKAHQDIYGIFLQMLTDGRLADKKGKLADFSNSIIIFTSNAGAHEIVDKFQRGSHPTPEELKVILRETGHFKDEFLGRVDSQIIPFKPISEEVASLIFDIHFGKFKKLMKTQHNVDLSISDQVKEHLLEIGFSPIYGARPIKSAIKSFLTPAMADKIIMGEVTKGCKVHLDLDDARVLIWDISETINEVHGDFE